MDPFSHPLPSQQQSSDPLDQLLTDGFPTQSNDERSEVKDTYNSRKLPKADREKLRRDRLNEQFLELGIALNPDRPKNDKAGIITDAVEMLKELAAEVRRLKAEHSSLSEESSDLIQEKNELREEKAILRSDVDNLNLQYQQRMRAMFPWTAIDPIVSFGASPMSFPTTTLAPDSHPSNMRDHVQAPLMPPFMPFPLHPSFQPFPFFGTAAPDMTNQYFPFPVYGPPVPSQTHVERPAAQYPSIQPFPGYLVPLQPNTSTLPNYVSQPTSGQECGQTGYNTLECQEGSSATESSCSDSGDRSHSCNCKAVPADLKAGPDAISFSSCQSSCSAPTSHDPDKLKEISARTKEETESASRAMCNPAGVCETGTSWNCSTSQHPTAGALSRTFGASSGVSSNGFVCNTETGKN